jgi:localization factor PodJL
LRSAEPLVNPGQTLDMAMNKAVPWSIKGVDFDAREAAQAAARRSGLSVGEWLNSVIAERAAEQQVTPDELDTEARLEAVTARLQNLSRGDEPRERRRGDAGGNLPLRERRSSDSPMRERPKPTAMQETEAEEAPRASSKPREIPFDLGGHSEALLDHAIAAFERRANAAQRQTANALADVNEWMEESRSHRKRDRDMLSTVADRLAKIEERVASRPEEDSFAPVRDAISRLEERFEALSRPAPAPPVIETTLRDLDEKLNALAARMDRPRPPPAPEAAPVPQRPLIRLQTREVGDAVAEIVRRRNHLDGVSHAPILLAQGMSGFDQRLEAITKRLEQAADHVSGRENRESTALEALQKEIAGLTSRLEDMRRGGLPEERHAEALQAGERRIDSLREEIAAMSRTLSELAPRASVEAIDLAIRELTLKVEASRMNGARDAVLAPIEQLASELREALAAFDPRAVVERLEGEIRSIARKLESFQADGGIDPDAFNRICEQTREVRDLLTAAVSRPLPVEKIEQQINALTQRLDALPVAMPRGEGADLGPSLGEIRSLIADAEAPAFKSLQGRLEALSDKFDDVAARAQHPSEFGELSKRLDVMHEALAARIADTSGRGSDEEAGQLTGMMRGLAEKLENALASRSDGAQEALERQIELLSQRLDKSDRSLASISSLDRSIGELFAQLEETRRTAVEAAEDAARNAVRNAAPGAALPKELSRELADLRSAQEVADQRLHATLTAVHDTLEKVVDRLSLLEDDVAGVRSDSERDSLASGAPPVFAPPRRGDDDNIGPAGLRLPDAKTGAAARVSDDADFLIEPGSGFKPGRGERQGKPAEKLQGGAPSQANFIAAARRAVAAAQASDTDVPGQGQKRRAAAKDSAVKAGVLSRFRDARAALNNRKRPILLGLGGLLLLIAAYQVLRMGGDKEAPPPTAKIEAPADAKPRSEATNPRPQVDISTPTRSFAAVKPAQPQSAPAGATPPTESPVPNMTAKADPAATSTITQPPAMIGNNGAPAKDGIAGLQSLAVTGDPSAQYELGSRYAEGRTVARDPKLAAQWFEKAANQGLAAAQYRMGSIYEKGIGVTRDLNISKTWYQRAADAGNTRAMHNLAVLIAEGTDGKPDYPAAANWFKQAAEYGVRDSQFNLAILYARGLGVGQNLVQSYVWFTLAAKQGDEDAGKKAQDVAARLDAKDLATAKSLAESFRPKQPGKAANEVAAPGSNWEGVKPPIGADLKIVAPKISRL